MFLGHIAVGFAAKRMAPRLNLGYLIGAALLIDLLWPFFLLAGLERAVIAPGDTAFTPLRFVSYPITHSLVGCAWWGALFAGLFLLKRRYWQGGLAILACTVSHWVLDVVTHRADMPLGPQGPYFGLALWNSVPATVLVEGALFAAGVWAYASATRGRSISLAILLVLLVAIYASLIFGPPPPDMRTVAYGGLLTWLFPFWAAWIDSSRKVIRPGSQAPRNLR